MLHELSGLNTADITVDYFEELPSTSDHLAMVIRDAKQDGDALSQAQLCIANWQTKGRGRRGKTWLTDRGNITFSLLTTMNKAPAELMGLSLVTGVVVAEVLRSSTNIPVMLKWPNDLLVDGDKICGLLTELTAANAAHTTYIVSGIGINYTPRQAGVDEARVSTDYRATSLGILCEQAPSRAHIIARVTAALLDAYAEFATKGWPAFTERWAGLDYLKGKSVSVINASCTEHAIALGVDASGALLVENKAGVRAVHSGEVSVRLS